MRSTLKSGDRIRTTTELGEEFALDNIDFERLKARFLKEMSFQQNEHVEIQILC